LTEYIAKNLKVKYFHYERHVHFYKA
jgi:hypothetical protein